MTHGFHDPSGSTERPSHGLDPRAATLLAVAFTITVVSTPPPHLLSFVIYAGILSWACALSRVPLHRVAIRAAGVLPFSVLAAVWMPFVAGGPAVSLFGGHLHTSVAGLWTLAGVGMKSFIGVGTAVWLASTTPFAELLNGLRRVGTPALIIDTLTLAHRYVFLLVCEASRLRRAAAARGYRPRWLGQAFLVGRLVGHLFVGSYERA